MTKIKLLNVYIALSSKFVGLGLNLALLKDSYTPGTKYMYIGGI